MLFHTIYPILVLEAKLKKKKNSVIQQYQTYTFMTYFFRIEKVGRIMSRKRNFVLRKAIIQYSAHRLLFLSIIFYQSKVHIPRSKIIKNSLDLVLINAIFHSFFSRYAFLVAEGKLKKKKNHVT